MIELNITSLGSDGEGIGSLDGLKVFVKGALPGERVQAEIVESKKRYAIAKLLSIIQPSAERITPLCPVFGICGGCQIMHLSYKASLIAKRDKVESALTRIGHLTDLTIEECVPSPLELHYRNKIQLPIVFENGQRKIGLYKASSHEVIPISKCYIQCEEGERIFQSVSPFLNDESLKFLLIKSGLHTKESLVILVTRQEIPGLKKEAERILLSTPGIVGVVENRNPYSTNVILSSDYRLLAGRPFIHEKLLGKTFRVSAPSFFQVNPLQAEQLYAKAIALADLKPSDRVLDAFCGVGTLALFAADQSHHVTGIECVAGAIDDGRASALLNHQTVQFKCGKAEELITREKPYDVVFLNPPRKGCEESLLKTLSERKTKTLIYISCDPATLARDLAFLVSRGYKVEIVIPFDMFPQTMHVETLVKLSLQQ